MGRTGRRRPRTGTSGSSAGSHLLAAGIGRGFSLAELLAVVLILSVLAAVAIPIYLNARRTSAARTCKANLAAIASAEAAMALRSGAYGDMANLTSAVPEGLNGEPKCPLTLAAECYTIMDAEGVVPHYDADSDSGGSALAITIACPNAASHARCFSLIPATEWSRNMPPLSGESAAPPANGNHGRGRGHGNGNANRNGNGSGNGNGDRNREGR